MNSRTKIVAGNWKMNKTMEEALKLTNELRDQRKNLSHDVEVIISPPSLYLERLRSILDDSIGVSAQNVSSHQDFGAYTGEYSAEMLNSINIKYAIVGHSERREYHHETDEHIAKKIKACIQSGIIPIYCCGENLDEREAGKYVEVVTNQITTALKDFESHALKNLIVAYEPVWAIGTGKTASAEQAQEMHAEIRKVLAKIHGNDFAKATRILYGGSCKPSNSESLFSQPDVDGGLIGGASLKAADFIGIIEAAAK